MDNELLYLKPLLCMPLFTIMLKKELQRRKLFRLLTNYILF